MTPFSKIYTYFDDNLTDSDIANVVNDKRLRFLRNSIPQFIVGTGKTITPDYNNEIISEDLSETDLNLLGLMMFREWINQELLKLNKIINISSDAFKITGSQDRVKNLKDFLVNTEAKINNLLASYI